MDIKWKVQVLDKMFDDTYVRNLYLKMKYNTLGRFSFDIRDFGTVEVESYFAVGNTIRIFWGDILKMEGVIQKLVKSTTSWGWSIYGCDLNGLLLDRTPNMPYELGCDTLTIANSVMYAGCDFPTSMWGVGDGEEQGAYVLRYKVGLNTAYKQLRNLPHDLTWQTTTGGEGGIVSSVTTTSIVDDTKTWVPDQWKGAHCRIVTGAMKNNVYEVLGNTANSLNLGLIVDGTRTYSHGFGWWPCSYGTCVSSDAIYLGCWGNYGSYPTWLSKYAKDGTLVTSWGSPNSFTDGKFNGYITGVAVDTAGYVYAIDTGRYSAGRIQKFTSDGQFVKTLVTTGNGLSWSQMPELCIYDGHLYVGVNHDNKGYLRKYTLDGGYVSEFPVYNTSDLISTSAPCAICFTENHIYMSAWNDQSHGILKYTRSGGFVQNLWMSSVISKDYNEGNMTYDGVYLYACGHRDYWYVINPITDSHVATVYSANYNASVIVNDGILYDFHQMGAGTAINCYNNLWSSSGGSSLGITTGDIYELTKGQTITWTKKYRVTNVKMTKNTHVINYNHTKDASKTGNSISVSGRDDNGGQIYTSLDDSSPITTLLSQESILSAPITASDTTIPVHDTTGFASSGEAWIE